MTIHARTVTAGKAYEGEIPAGAIRLILSLGYQATGRVTVGDQKDQPLYYGKNEYVTQGASSYTVTSEDTLEFVEDFIYLPATVDEYIKAKFDEMMAPVNAKLNDHEERITELEEKPGQGPPGVPA